MTSHARFSPREGTDVHVEADGGLVELGFRFVVSSATGGVRWRVGGNSAARGRAALKLDVLGISHAPSGTRGIDPGSVMSGRDIDPGRVDDRAVDLTF